ncbi:MAG: apolipoprotein A1/A4/E family protein [Polyangiaceae bacterium]|jgi:hypothetical protein|nr:apolipoprotein A1/A4/E family protein [Polyangiaceae bacterium]
MNEKQTSLSGQTGTNATAGTGLTTAPTANVVAEAGKTIAQDAKHVANEVVGQAKQQVASKIEDQREKAAQGLNSVAGAIRQTTEGLRERDQLGVTPYVEGLADQVERFSDYILSSNVGQLVGEVEGFARREPAIFLGGAFLLGLVGARFLKSSGPAYESHRALGDNAYDYIRDEPRSAYGAGSYGRGDNDRLSPGGRYNQRETNRDYDDDRGARGQSQGVSERTRVASNGTYGTGTSSNGTYGTGTSTGGAYGTGTGSSTSSYDKGTSSSSGTSSTGTSSTGTSTGGTYGTGTSAGGMYGTGTSGGGTHGTGTSGGGTYGMGTSSGTTGAMSTGGTYGSGTGAVSNAGTATSTAGGGTSASPGGTYGAGAATGSTATPTTGTGLDPDAKSGSTLPGTGKTTTEAAGTSAVKPSESTGKR